MRPAPVMGRRTEAAPGLEPSPVPAPPPQAARRRRGVLLGVAACVVMLGFGTSLVVAPGWRAEVLRQAELSLTRQPTAFVEAALARQGEVVSRSGTVLTVRLDTRSHAPTATTERIRVIVDDAGRTRLGERDVVLVPGPWQAVGVQVDQVSGRWTSVRVQLLTSDLQLEWRRVSGRQEIRA